MVATTTVLSDRVVLTPAPTYGVGLSPFPERRRIYSHSDLLLSPERHISAEFSTRLD